MGSEMCIRDRFDILCNDLYLLDAPGVLTDLFDDLDDVITRGDVELAEKIRDYELAAHSREVARVRDVDEFIKGLEAQMSILRARIDGLEGERARAAVAAVESGIAKEQIATATGRDVDDVNQWLRGE